MGVHISIECDECGRNDVVGCIGGTHYYCYRHEDKVAAIHAYDMAEKE